MVQGSLRILSLGNCTAIYLCGRAESEGSIYGLCTEKVMGRVCSMWMMKS